MFPAAAGENYPRRTEIKYATAHQRKSITDATHANATFSRQNANALRGSPSIPPPSRLSRVQSKENIATVNRTKQAMTKERVPTKSLRQRPITVNTRSPRTQHVDAATGHLKHAIRENQSQTDTPVEAQTRRVLNLDGEPTQQAQHSIVVATPERTHKEPR